MPVYAGFVRRAGYGIERLSKTQTAPDSLTAVERIISQNNLPLHSTVWLYEEVGEHQYNVNPIAIKV